MTEGQIWCDMKINMLLKIWMKFTLASIARQIKEAFRRDIPFSLKNGKFYHPGLLGATILTWAKNDESGSEINSISFQTLFYFSSTLPGS